MSFKIYRTLKITSNDFYDQIEKGLMQDIEKSTNKNIKKKDIKKGFSYSKSPKNTGTRIDIKIEEYTRGSIYQVATSSGFETLRICYKTKQTNEGLYVEMEEYVQSYEETKNKKPKFIRFWSELIYYSRMSSTLYDMVTKIQLEKKGVQPVSANPLEPFKKIRKDLQKKQNNE